MTAAQVVCMDKIEQKTTSTKEGKKDRRLGSSGLITQKNQHIKRI